MAFSVLDLPVSRQVSGSHTLKIQAVEPWLLKVEVHFSAVFLGRPLSSLTGSLMRSVPAHGNPENLYSNRLSPGQGLQLCAYRLLYHSSKPQVTLSLPCYWL